MMAKGCGCGMGRVSKPRKKAKKCVYRVGGRVFRTKKSATAQAKRTGGKVQKSCYAARPKH